MKCKFDYKGICNLTKELCLPPFKDAELCCPDYEEDEYYANPDNERDLQE